MVIWHPKNAVWAIVVAILAILIGSCTKEVEVPCPQCYGKGRVWAGIKECNKCNGRGYVTKRVQLWE